MIKQNSEANLYVFILQWEGRNDVSAGLLGIYSSLENAQTEAQRYNKKITLEWREGLSDDGRQKLWDAQLTTWATPDTWITITKYRLDSKKFR